VLVAARQFELAHPEWCTNLKAEEFREMYQARGVRWPQRGRQRAQRIWADRAALVLALPHCAQSGFMRILRGRDRVGRRVSILLPMRFPEVRASILSACVLHLTF
jgi:hypothetical protein